MLSALKVISQCTSTSLSSTQLSVQKGLKLSLGHAAAKLSDVPLQIQLTQLPSLPPAFGNSPDAQKELVLARTFWFHRLVEQL